jgi:Leucine-rich repeat (LRR) protein
VPYNKDDTADEQAISAALRAGRPVLRPGTRPSHLVALDELDALLPRAEGITELDLSDRKLRQLPEQLYAFPHLRVLSLAGNDAVGSLAGLDERIGDLTALEELDLSGMGLTSLPESIGRLRSLRVLNVSGNDFTAPCSPNSGRTCASRPEAPADGRFSNARFILTPGQIFMRRSRIR